MAERLPPLNALRTFEAAARHLSFTKAAAELFVTQAAVSHQIKALEEYLGMPLFRRLNRALMLTDEGQALRALCARRVRPARRRRAPAAPAPIVRRADDQRAALACHDLADPAPAPASRAPIRRSRST